MADQNIPFTKMHGLGNDYVYVNGFFNPVDDPSTLARSMSARHFGVGSDGLILVLPPTRTSEADVRMRMFNADGSEAEMCGNGIRCVCKFTYDRGLSTHNPMRIETGNGILCLQYTTGLDGKVAEIAVDMGRPELAPKQVPVAIDGAEQVVNLATDNLFPWRAHGDPDWKNASGLDHHMTCVSMGNPHAIFFCDDLSAVPLATIGPIIERHPIFPQRINVHFALVHGRRELTMRTWERGSGITMACGTGASAACVAAVLTDRTDREIRVHLDGGDLRLHWVVSTDHVTMTGPATEVFQGQWPLGRDTPQG